MEITAEHWLVLAIVILFTLWGVAIFCFGRISVKHIENEMAKEGKLPPEWDKGIGARLAAYSSVNLFPNINRHASLIDVESTKRYGRKIDWYLAFFVKATFYVLVLMAVLALMRWSASLFQIIVLQ
ncbi:hypothetical protein [Thalassomonas sp. RHCl1]|uniref:hypothetical protein n=1 Tax=Thalassomonas sp. RHCl1 TaxID=2995320 RepID=UPI00248AE38C|nr:hypothetical protein [Thalassomonas sp. RHCl1]